MLLVDDADVGSMFFFFCCKQKTAYEMRISDWSSDVCSSDLTAQPRQEAGEQEGRDRGDDAHAKLSDKRRGGGGGHVGKLLGLAQHAMRLFDDRIAEPGEAHDAAGAFDERLAAQRLELANARRQRRMRHVAGRGGAADMAGPGQARRSEGCGCGDMRVG